MDVVLVGLPGSGKTAIGRRLANRHGAAFVDLDDRIEAAAGRRIPEIFAEDGEPAFRRLEREAVAALGPPDPDPVAAPRDLARRRGGRGPAQPVAAVPRPRPDLARRPARGPRPAAPPLAHGPAAHPGRRPAGPHPRISPRPASGSTGPRGGSTASPRWAPWWTREPARDGGADDGHDPAAGADVDRRAGRRRGRGGRAPSGMRCGGWARRARSSSRSPGRGRRSARGWRRRCGPTAGRSRS